MTRPRPRALRFRARPGAFLYDCHSRQFAPLDQGRSIVHSFVPMYLSRMFGVGVQDWHGFLRRSIDTLDAMDPALRDGWIAAHAPVHDAAQAVDLALLVNPSAERYLLRDGNHPAPFVLRDEHLYQRNVPLAALEARQDDGSWAEIVEIPQDAEQSWCRALRRTLASFGPGSMPAARPSTTSEEHRVLERLGVTGALPAGRPEREEPPPPPGLYLIGHSGLLVRGRRSGLIIDPVFSSALGFHADALRPSALTQAATAAALTHGHFDHYHLPTLLGLSDRPLIAPKVPRASIVCEQIGARLEQFGHPDVRTPGWHTTLELDEFKIHVLPFYGEQFLTSEIYPDARNWGNVYVIEYEGLRVLVAVDSGFEKDRSVLELVADWVAVNGPVDIVAAQSIGLRTAFGGGDPDLQITALACAPRAHETVELLRPERRVTLLPEDIPALCATAGARWFVPYGQFVVARGRPGVDESMAGRLDGLLSSRAPGVHLAWLGIGDGLSLAGDGATVSFPP